MNRFGNTREAKDFLVDRIAGEAQREGIPLSEAERKMLYFSEAASTLPEIIDVNDAFNRDYNQQDYEKKIARLIRNARKRARREGTGDLKTWSDAIRTLSTEDHYLLLMLESSEASVRRPSDLLKLWATALAVVCMGVFVPLYLSERFGIDLTRDSISFFIWVTAASVFGTYLLLCIFLGREKVDRLVNRMMDRLFSLFR